MTRSPIVNELFWTAKKTKREFNKYCGVRAVLRCYYIHVTRSLVRCCLLVVFFWMLYRMLHGADVRQLLNKWVGERGREAVISIWFSDTSCYWLDIGNKRTTALMKVFLCLFVNMKCLFVCSVIPQIISEWQSNSIKCKLEQFLVVLEKVQLIHSHSNFGASTVGKNVIEMY